MCAAMFRLDQSRDRSQNRPNGRISVAAAVGDGFVTNRTLNGRACWRPKAGFAFITHISSCYPLNDKHVFDGTEVHCWWEGP
jgi:hypothetical protein